MTLSTCKLSRSVYMQFSSLEPDVLCRLVYVRDVEFTRQEDDVLQQTPPGFTLCSNSGVL